MNRKLLFTGAVVVLTLLCAGRSWAQADSGLNVSNTQSTAEIDTIQNVSVSQEVDQYSVDILGRLEGGSILYNQTFSVPFSDPTVQSAVAAAEGILTGAGAVSFIGPSLQSNNKSLLFSTPNTVTTVTGASPFDTHTDEFIGPQTIPIGDVGACQSYTLGALRDGITGCSTEPYPFSSGTPPVEFTIAPGSADFDTITLISVAITETTTTTNTYQITQEYGIDGVTAQTSTPELGTWVLALLGLAATVVYRLRLKRGSMFLGLVVVLTLLCAGRSWAQSNTTTTQSTAEIDTIQNVSVTQEVDQYSVDILARLEGGSILYNQTFSVPFSDPTVQSAVAAAEGILAGAGAVSFIGPSLQSNSKSLLFSVPNTVTTLNGATVLDVHADEFIGPQTIPTGDVGACQSYTLGALRDGVTGCSTEPYPFSSGVPPVESAIAPGAADVDTLTLFSVSITETTTTTNTYQITQEYEIDGVTAQTSTPEPGTWVLALLGLAAIIVCRLRPKRGSIFLGIVVVLTLLCAGRSWAQSNITTTQSTAAIDTIQNVSMTQEVDQYSVDILARLEGGSILYNQTFSVPFSDPSVQSAVAAAEGILTGAGAVSFIGPSLQSNNTTLLFSVPNTVTTLNGATVLDVHTDEFIGPQTIPIGTLGACQSYTLGALRDGITGCSTEPYPFSNGTPPVEFAIVPGAADFDTLTLYSIGITETTTTTNTYQITQEYEIDGVTAQTSTPEPGTWVLALLGLAAIVLYALRRRSGARS